MSLRDFAIKVMRPAYIKATEGKSFTRPPGSEEEFARSILSQAKDPVYLAGIKKYAASLGYQIDE